MGSGPIYAPYLAQMNERSSPSTTAAGGGALFRIAQSEGEAEGPLHGFKRGIGSPSSCGAWSGA
jgi:hypothetical protein